MQNCRYLCKLCLCLASAADCLAFSSAFHSRPVLVLQLEREFLEMIKE